MLRALDNRARRRCNGFPVRGAGRRSERASRPVASHGAVSLSLLFSHGSKGIGNARSLTDRATLSPGLLPAGTLHDG